MTGGSVTSRARKTGRTHIRGSVSGWAMAVLVEVLAVTVLLMGAAARAQPDNMGKTGFERICSGCHGDKGAGDIGPRLVPFTWSNREVLAIVREGNGMMPAMSVRDISDEEVAAVAEYLRSLSPRTDRDNVPKGTTRLN